MVVNQPQQSPRHSVDGENHPVMEGLPEIILNTLVDELLVLCETIVDFKSLKDNSFNFSEILEFQGWKGFFERLIGPVYPVLVKKFWIHVVYTKDTITSFFMNMKIVVTLKSFADSISYNGCGKRVYNVKTGARREAMVASIIFKEGINLDEGKGPNAKDLTDKLRVWFKIILGCIHHRPSTNLSYYININQKYMLLFLERRFKLALPTILFKFLRDSIRENQIGSTSKKGGFISNGSLIFDLLVENGLVDDLMVSGLIEELVKDAGNFF